MNDPYVEPGATAANSCDGDISDSIVTGGDVVDTSTVATYQVTYNVEDGEGNAAVTVTRTVNVVDTSQPYVISVTVLSGNGIEVVFSKNMGAGVDVASNYTLSGTGRGTLAANPASVAMGADLTTWVLTWGGCPGLMHNGGDIKVTVNASVADEYGNTMTAPYSGTNKAGAIAAIPLILMNGINNVSVECGGDYYDSGATATDSCSTDITALIVVMNTVNPAVIGTYTVTYNVVDAAGNAAAEVVRTVHVVDTTAPTITRLGSATVDVECGSVYTDAGATAADACEGDLTASIVRVNPVNTAEVGTYKVTYNVSDSASNAAAQRTRTVNVVDTTAPVITRIGSNAVVVECGSTYVDAGATALDVCEGPLTSSIVTVNPVDTGVPGTYTVTYNVSDSVSNAAPQRTRTVSVVDNTVPVITLTGTSPVTVECGSVYSDAGATASDVCDGNITGRIVTTNPVDTGVVGTYTVRYNVEDAATNVAAQVIRTVHVVDMTVPVLTLSGSSTVTIECGGSYTDVGATAVDVCDGDLTDSVVTVNPVNTAVPGTYTIRYNVSDAHSNAAGEVTCTVHVVDTTAPVITLLGNATDTIKCGSVYTDAGATAVDECGGDLTGSIVTVNPVDEGVTGTYTVTYNVSDGLQMLRWKWCVRCLLWIRVRP